MKVKIGNEIFDSNEQPIMLILSDVEKQHIADMLPEAHHYCSAPTELSEEDVREFMKLDSE